MIINVGSQNKTKIKAVKESVILYPNLFINPEIVGIDIQIDLFGHPKNLSETIRGAIARANQSFKNCDYSFGIEGGLIEVPQSKTGFMEIGVCSIYDGKKNYLGLSPAFEWPTEVTKLILTGTADASQAFKQLNLTEYEKLGAMDGGILGFLTNRRLTREDQIRSSIIMALIQLERPELY